MDVGPFRTQQPADRRVVSRPELPRRQPEEPQPVPVEPKPVHRTTPPSHVAKEKKSLKRFLLPIGAIIIIILGVAGWFAWSNMQNPGTAIDSSKYQAVFFTNGQVYFGKLKPFNNEYMQLTDIYYLQTQTTDKETDSKNPQKTSTNQNDVQLIKLGDEIHGPEDQMTLSKDQVLFYENLKPDSKVAQSIEKYKISK
jgi:hypothetical protein